MAMIADLRLWNSASNAVEQEEYDRAVDTFERIGQKSSKTLYNTACCLRALNKLEEAEQYLNEALLKDEHLAIGYFQRGNIYFLQNKFGLALNDFERCAEKFRGRKVIDYNQLGLKYKFYICEPLHNAGCVRIKQDGCGERTSALDLLLQAQRAQAEARHCVIQDSIRMIETGQQPSLITIPADVIFRPPKSKVSNLSKKDYLGKAQVLSVMDGNSNVSGFEAPKKFESGLLTIEEIKHRSTSAPSSPARSRRKPILPPPPSVADLQAAAAETKHTPAALPKSVFGYLIFSSASFDPMSDGVKSSSSDPTIHRTGFSRTSQVVRNRDQQCQMPLTSQFENRSGPYSTNAPVISLQQPYDRGENMEGRSVNNSSRELAERSSRDMAQNLYKPDKADKLDQYNKDTRKESHFEVKTNNGKAWTGYTSNIPPPPTKPLPPRPQSRTRESLSQPSQPERPMSQPSQPMSHTYKPVSQPENTPMSQPYKQMTQPSLPSKPANKLDKPRTQPIKPMTQPIKPMTQPIKPPKPAVLSQPSQPSQPSKPLKPTKPDKPSHLFKPTRPAERPFQPVSKENEEKNSGTLNEFQALRAALKPVRREEPTTH